MKLPQKISDCLYQDVSLSTTVNHALEASREIISTKPEFFPEYTDHGPDHNSEVLDTALAILTEQATKLMSNSDMAALTLAVLLHDCGMHLTGDIFVKLISPENIFRTRLDTETWKELWDEFLLEAKRFDGRQLRNLFGSPEPVSEPPSDPADFNLKHRLLIGEFLRRHHPRLAHEIAVFGFPVQNGERIKILREGAGDLAEISGLIARSHGMSLRNACDVFKDHFHEREYQGIHPPVIMAALRIADYLQVQPERAPESTLKLHKLRSPFSSGEWRVHQSVRNITPADDDPEAIFVDAQPATVETYLKFKHWAKGFQTELDSTWAALGEVYGRYGDHEFDKFQLKLRRLRTSIDDERRFSDTAPYLPAKIAFEASSPDLLGLLVAPLYGNKPEVGLRELIQNSLDSVIERVHIEGRQPTETLLQRDDIDVIVYPVLEYGEVVKVVVEDRGIGMNADVIQNYFLRAGASFRSSPQWKKSFATDLGQSDIARTGRFGIGALAGFLIGSKIDVETKRLGATEGLQFSAELDKEAIEVKKCKREVGTKISIHVDEEKRTTVGELFRAHGNEPKRWDWYCNSWPQLLRVDQEGEEIEPRFIFSEENIWVSIDASNYSSVQWSLQKIKDTVHSHASNNVIYGNGIYICDVSGYGTDHKIISEHRVSPSFRLSAPTVLVTDKNGHLPLNLQRDGFTGIDGELSDALRHSMSRDLIAQAIARAPEVQPFSAKIYKQLRSRRLDCVVGGDQYNRRPRPHWCWEDGGWRLADPGIATRKPYLLVLHGEVDLSFLMEDHSVLSDVSLVWQSSGASPFNFQEIKGFFGSLVKDGLWSRPTSDSLNGYQLPFQTVFSDSVLKKLNSGILPNYLTAMLSNQIEQFGSHVVLKNGSIDHPVLTRLKSELKNADASPFLFTFAGGENRSQMNDDDILVALWSELIGEAAIPAAYEDRKIILPKAFHDLGPRIEYYREVMQQKNS